MQSRVTGKATPPLSRMRTQIDIIAGILDVTIEGARKTRIMYGCNLSYKQLQTYLKLLQGMELLMATPVKERNKTSFFETTEKGRDFLVAYRNLKALMSSSSSTP